MSRLAMAAKREPPDPAEEAFLAWRQARARVDSLAAAWSAAKEVERKAVAALMREAISGRLAPRQQQVLDLRMRGLCNKEVASEMGISVRAVRNNVSSLLRKMHITGGGPGALTAAMLQGEPIISRRNGK